jgi:hypothetical protein
MDTLRMGGLGLGDFCREFDRLFPIGSVVGHNGVERFTESHAMAGDRRGATVFVSGLDEAVLIARLKLPGVEVFSKVEGAAKRRGGKRDG